MDFGGQLELIVPIAKHCILRLGAPFTEVGLVVKKTIYHSWNTQQCEGRLGRVKLL